MNIEIIVHVPLAEIEVNEGFVNCRSGAYWDDGADPDSDDGGYEGLKASMRVLGKNTTPVLLRRLPSGRYQLVDGFRRCRAARELGFLTLRAVVEVMTDFQARLRNIQAAVGPARFKVADLAWGLADLRRLGGPECTSDRLATEAGISSRHVNRLLRIMTELDPKVTTAWRASPVQVNIDDLLNLTHEHSTTHWAKWEALVQNSQTKPGRRAKTSAQASIVTKARERGRELRALLATVGARQLRHRPRSASSSRPSSSPCLATR